MGGLCCLVVVGGLPRSWCLCPDVACRAACNTRANLLPAPASSDDATACSCCQRPAPVSDLSADAPQLVNADCACEMQVTQLVLASAERHIQTDSAPVAIWSASADAIVPTSDLTGAAISGLLVDRPPGSPVTRAQILRL
jgi:hypothetical protein